MVNGNQHNQHGILWHTTEANGPGPFAPLPGSFVVYGHFLSVDGSCVYGCRCSYDWSTYVYE